MKRDNQFLMDRMSMMETSGWLDLKEDMSNLESNITNVDNINSEQDLGAVKGQLRVINFILSLETATTIALEELQDGNPT